MKCLVGEPTQEPAREFREGCKREIDNTGGKQGRVSRGRSAVGGRQRQASIGRSAEREAGWRRSVQGETGERRSTEEGRQRKVGRGGGRSAGGKAGGVHQKSNNSLNISR